MSKPRFLCTGPIDKFAQKTLKPFGDIVVSADYTEKGLLAKLTVQSALLSEVREVLRLKSLMPPEI